MNLARRRLKVNGDEAIRLLGAAVKDERFEGWQWNVQNFNDWPQRKFADVRLAIQLAIALSIGARRTDSASTRCYELSI